MATIKFRVLGKKDPVNLNVRFFHNKIDCSAKSNIFINAKNWNNKTSKVKNLLEEEKKEIEDKIDRISKFIIQSFNRDFSIGENIDSEWLEKQIDMFYNKPKGEDDYQFYFTPFVAKFIEESKSRINPKSGKLIADKTIQNYSTTLKRLVEFENKKGCKIKTKDINLDFHNKFTSYLVSEGGYTGTLIEKYISHVKYFVKEAKMKGYDTSIEIESNKFTFRRDETIDTYLNEKEIDVLFNINLEENPRLDSVRDLLIVGVWTGLRISDLKRINEFDKTNNRIRIIATEKNSTPVEIPMHPQLKAVLEKRNNIMPQISSQKFNLYVKELCQLADINESTLGNIKDPKTNRKVKKYYPKYQLISSHTCRRSFVTNHYGKIDDRTLMAISTHKSVTQFLKYVKTTSKEYANKLEAYWNNQEALKKDESKLKIV